MHSHCLCRPGMTCLLLILFAVSTAAGGDAISGGLAGHPPANHFERFSLASGLSQSVVADVVQDCQGLLWLATQDGLNRYDGVSFVVYRHDPEQPRSLTDNKVNCLLTAPDGTLWIGTTGGLNRFRREHEQFDRYFFESGRSGREDDNWVRCLAATGDGRIWAGIRGFGLFCLNPVDGRQQHWPKPAGWPAGAEIDIRALTSLPEGRLLLGTDAGLFLFTERTGEWHAIAEVNQLLNQRGKKTILSFFRYREAEWWLGTEAGIIVWRQPDRTAAWLPLPDAGPDGLPVQGFHRHSSGQIWAATGRGVLRFAPDGRLLAIYRHDPADSASLPINDCMCIIEDHSGILWLGTYAGGLCKLDLKRERFRNTGYREAGPAGVGHPFVRSFLEDHKKRVWAGTDRGADVFAPDGRVWRRYRSATEMAGGLAGVSVQCMFQDRQETIWLGTEAGLNRLRPGEEGFGLIHIQTGSSGHDRQNDVMALLENRAGELWLGTYGGGMICLDRSTGRGRRYLYHPQDPASLSNNDVNCLLEDRHGRLWIGTNHGLNYRETGRSNFRRYLHDPENRNSLSDNRIRCLLEDGQGHLWIGTRGGLNRMNDDEGHFTRYSHREGLPGDIIYGILEDGSGQLWISGSRGLARLNPQNGVIRCFRQADGLPSDEFNQGAYLKLSTGEMLFGGIDGFTRFFPEEIRENQQPPPVVITGFRKAGKPFWTGRSMLTAPEVRLDYRDHTVAFDFVGLDFTDPLRNRYAYRLEGFDEEWIDNGNGRSAVYTNLEGGEYTFRVRAANSDGVWNNEGCTLRVVVVPPFWKTAWFRIGAVLLLAGLLNAAYFAGKKIWRTVIFWRKSAFIAHFRTLKILGRGGMGTVYQAANIITGETVALKLLHEGLEESTRSRFIREGLVCEKIRHPGIVQIFERGEHNGQLYYSMEFIEGQPLRSIMTTGPLPVAESLLIASVILDILHAIHQAGVIHRDIKPENIMLRKGFDLASLARVDGPENVIRRNLKILDFGVAKFAGHQTLTNAAMPSGTLQYIPPEHLGSGGETAAAYDFYSLGMLVREMLTGQKPYEGETPAAVIYAILSLPLPPLAELRPSVPPGVAAWVDSLICKDPAFRCRDYQAIRPALDELLAAGSAGDKKDRTGAGRFTIS